MCGSYYQVRTKVNLLKNQNLEIDRQYWRNKTSQCRDVLVQQMQQKEIGWKTNFVLFSFYLCFFIFLTSCETGRDSGIPDFDTSEHSPEPISENLVARIYFDATLSMQGFVVPGSTRYTKMCRYLESVIVSGWENGTVDFFRFGEQVESIDRNTYLRVGYTDFYGDRNINRETFIQRIIDHENQLVSDGMDESSIPEESEVVNNSKEENPLVVIVTDLFQDRRDITVLVSQLKEQYIQKGFEVGLLGLRSEFDGTVYDLYQINAIHIVFRFHKSIETRHVAAQCPSFLRTIDTD